MEHELWSRNSTIPLASEGSSYNQNIPSRPGTATCAGRAAEPVGLFVERGGGGPALALSADLGSGGLKGVEAALFESLLESDGRRRRDVGVEGGFVEGEGEGELGELVVRERVGGGIAIRGGAVDTDDVFGY